MFDTLNRRFLPPYGAKGLHAPSFERLARRSVQFENCYCGSMPGMAARREMHNAPYYVLHRSWGPPEPVDDPVPRLRNETRLYTAPVDDHHTYSADGMYT